MNKKCFKIWTWFQNVIFTLAWNWVTYKMEMAHVFGLTNEETINVDRMSPGCLLERQIIWIESHSAGSHQQSWLCFKTFISENRYYSLKKSELYFLYRYEWLQWTSSHPSLNNSNKTNEKRKKGWGWVARNNCFFRIFLCISLHTASICQLEIKISAWWTILAFSIYVLY